MSAKSSSAATAAPPTDKSAKAPAGKKEKDTRTKEQIKAEQDAAEARKLLDLWRKYKQFINFAFGEGNITQDAENQFLSLTGALQQEQRVLLSTLPRDINFGSDKMTDMLRDSVSLKHLRDMPKVDKGTALANWHSAYILLTRAAGAMAFIAEGYKHEAEVERQVDLRSIKAGGRVARRRQEWYKNPSIVTMILVGACVVVFMLDYMGVIRLPF